MYSSFIPILFFSILVSAEPQTPQFQDSYYETMLAGLGENMPQNERTYEREQDDKLNSTPDIERREIKEMYDEQEEPYVENNDVYDEYPEELADQVDYEYEDHNDNHLNNYDQNNDHDGNKLNSILYGDDKFEGREVPEEETEENSSKVDIREFTLMISKLLFRLAQM
eukprot:TRINITY_DN23245_c0_g1_i1.p1 TRINITY_DN23245_c0_g1~~TRINITY_DN23245_c0_g1_i1.p1  ORF type:complete len:168 (-),score=46.37 TRINITY_DN23245_c0_g1_i1:51-554(-)